MSRSVVVLQKSLSLPKQKKKKKQNGTETAPLDDDDGSQQNQHHYPSSVPENNTTTTNNNNQTGMILDNFCSPAFLQTVESIRSALPLDAQKRPTVQRRFFHDRCMAVELQGLVREAATAAATATEMGTHSEHQEDVDLLVYCNPYLRILEYNNNNSSTSDTTTQDVGGGDHGCGCVGLAPHTDGTKLCDETHHRSTHTVLLYLTDNTIGDNSGGGGETVLLDDTTDEWSKPHNAVVVVPEHCLFPTPPIIMPGVAASEKEEEPRTNTSIRVHRMDISKPPPPPRPTDPNTPAPVPPLSVVRLGIPPRRGRILAMPHAWPHAGAPCRGTCPKILVRAEMTWHTTTTTGGQSNSKQNDECGLLLRKVTKK